MGIFVPGGWRHRGAGQLRKHYRGFRTWASCHVCTFT